MEQTPLDSAVLKRAALSIAVRESDIVRFAIRDPDLSQSEINDITGIPVFPGKIGGAALKGSDKLAQANGWFALRTCSPQFFRDEVVRLHRGNLMFWSGVMDGYRTGIKMGEPEYLQHAKNVLEIYAGRILLQLEMSKHEGLRPDFYPSWMHPMEDAIAAVSELINNAPILYAAHEDPVQALLDDISEQHETAVGLGDYIIHSPSENGYWSNSFGWVTSKGVATPFDEPSDIFILPGTGDAHIMSFHKERGSMECSAKYRAKMA